jgi:penicillin-binding protein 2
MRWLRHIFDRKTMNEAQVQFTFSRRSVVLGGAQLSIGALLAARMSYISVFENERYALLAESNRVNLSLIPPRRGWIVDRQGKPLALNRTVFRVDIIPDRLKDKRRELDALQTLLKLTPDERDRIERDINKAAGFQPVQVAENLDWERYAAISIRAPDLPGVQPAQGFARYYPEGAAVGHLIGYVGAASANDYERDKDPLLITPGFKVGKDGIEKVMETVLRGKPGARRSEVTARGKLVRDLATRPDVVGNTVQLTIDAGLQAYAARRLGTNSGALTVIDVANGEILAMVSMPSYDPNSFSDGIGRLEYASLTGDDHLPLRNKVLQGLYPPGSTVKPMNALALLSAGVDPNATVACSGSYRVGSGVFHCWKRGGHGAINMHRAVEQSCDVYFYRMAQTVGYDHIAKTARLLGLGEKYDLPYESQSFGTVPDAAWKLRKYKTAWTIPDTINASIGQGYLLANPFQLAVMAARIASGRSLVPTLVRRPNMPSPAPLGVTPEHLAFVHEAMSAVVNANGTAAAARMQIPGIQIGGKTGTAQVRRITTAERARGVLNNASLPFKLRDHALFVCFAPVDNPRYAAGIVLEHNAHLIRNLDTPMIARDVLTYLFDPALAMKSLLEVEPSWGGDLHTRMAAKAAGWRVAAEPASQTSDVAASNASADVPDAAPAPDAVGTAAPAR